MCLEEKKVTFTTKRNKGMSLELVTAGLKEKVGEDCGLGATLKFDFGDDGMLMLDATQVPNVISNDDGDAQCTMVISIENFMEMAEGKLDGTAAFMSGKLKIQGDMGIAMKLAPILS
jgi:putative sterol carrier protein